MNILTSDISHQCLTLKDFSKQTINKFVEKISHYKVAVLQDTDPEALHKMRVGMRKLRSILQILEPVVILPRVCNRQSIGKMAKVLGVVRDLDVAIETLKNVIYQDLPSYENQVSKEIHAVLYRRRHKAFKKLRVCLNKEYRAFMAAYSRWLENPRLRSKYIANKCISDVLPDLILPKIAIFFLHEGWSVTDLKNKRCKQTMHDLRKCTKGIRYQIEYFLPYLNASTTPFLPVLETSQELLGQMQDGLVIRKLLKIVSCKKGKQKLPILSCFFDEKTAQAWKDWQSTKTQLCNQDWRRSLRMALI
jgi:CHAD domain-containing protein